MDNDKNSQGNGINFDQIQDEGIITEPLDPLSLDIDDEDLVENVDARILAGQNFYKDPKYDLYHRRERNELYRFGRQIIKKEKDRQLKKYESRYLDNVLYEIEQTI